MTWFAAHIIMAVKLKSGRQARFPVWENIVLIQATSDQEAYRKAEQIGHLGEGDDDGTFQWGGKPALWAFAGVRKLTECALSGDPPHHGTEITYNELELDSAEGVERFAAGEPIAVRHTDRFARVIETEPTPVKRPSRKRA